MTVKINIRRINGLLPGILFSGLGVFAWLLLANYTEMSPKAGEALRSPWAGFFFVAIFNVLGWLTVRLSAWINTQYLLNARKKWKIALIYAAVIMIFLLVNYGFLVMGKLLAGVAQPFIFPNGGILILLIVWFVELVVLGLLLANRSMAQTLQLQQQAAMLHKENNAARYAALQSQLNPHFLFNSLNTLVAEIEYDTQQAVRFTRKLSDVYRYVLQVQNKPLVTLSEELKFAMAFLYLHRVRLGDCIHFHTDIPAEEQGYRLPPLTLQLLIENVIKHNAITSSHPMKIIITVTGGWLTVSNTLRPKKSAQSTGIGLENLSNRCRFTSGQKIKVMCTEDCFTVKIPLLYE